MNDRRRLLRLLAASPVFACSGITTASLAKLFASGQIDEVIAAPEQAINVMDFEPAARRKLPPAHFGYLATGVDDDPTVPANPEAFARFQLPVRRLIDVPSIDTRVRLF